MTRTVILLLLFCLLPLSLTAQEPASDFRLTEVNVTVGEHPNRFDLSTPLKAYVSLQYLKSEGQASRYRAVASYRTRGFFPPADAPVEAVKSERRQAILATPVRAVISYRETVAGLLTPFHGSLFIVTYFTKERGEWRHAGEDLGNDFADACAVFRKKAANFAAFAARSAQLQTVRATADSMAAYVGKHGRAPRVFLLDALAKHRLVVYGEVHRRKASWDLLREVLADSRFTERVGTLFLEISADAQGTLDAFLASPTHDPEALWSIFQNVQLNGWYDRGLYEFLNDLWALQQRLPNPRRLRVVAVDERRPFASFRTAEEMERHFRDAPDRNSQMAETIAGTLEASADTRHALFIVGAGHAYRSRVPGFAVGRPATEAKPSAAAQLVERLGPGAVFTIFPHTAIITNDGRVHGLVRQGVLDAAFAKLGDRPVAFAIQGSPLAKEPFDGLHEIAYAEGVGDFASNYDGYLFLGPLASEPAEYLFADFVTDAFVEELKRRASLTGASVEKWFGVSSATRQAIVESIEKRTATPLRWPRICTNLAGTGEGLRRNAAGAAVGQRREQSPSARRLPLPKPNTRSSAGLRCFAAFVSTGERDEAPEPKQTPEIGGADGGCGECTGLAQERRGRWDSQGSRE